PRVALALETLRAGLLGRSGRSGLPRTSEAGAEALLDGGAHVLRGGPGNELAEPDGPRARRRGAGAEEPLPVLEEDRAVLEQSSADACLCATHQLASADHDPAARGGSEPGAGVERGAEPPSVRPADP